MGLFFACLASFFGAFNNYAQRKSIDLGGTCKAFIVFQLFTSFLAMMLLNFSTIKNLQVGKEVLLLGFFGGLILSILTWGIGKTLEKGPPGLTFAIFFSASIVPSFLFFLFFGPPFGYSFTIWNTFGSLFVLAGLFWAAFSSKKKDVKIEVAQKLDIEKKGSENKHRSKWAYFMGLSFAAHALFLAYLAFWALILKEAHPKLAFLSIPESHRGWFMPIMMLTATIFQVFFFLTEKRIPAKKEVFYGVGGGVCNGLCTYFLILAPQKASFWENAMLFPTYAVLIILICNAWAQILYKEKVHWKANFLAFIGIALGSLG